MLNVRLTKDTEKQLNEYCQDEGVTKSMVVKEALVAYLSQKKVSKSPYEAGEDLFGQEGSGVTNHSATYKQKLKDKIRGKHTH
ncbi:MAG: CopG family transcriptional regulator [Bacteroidota bacterium]